MTIVLDDLTIKQSYRFQLLPVFYCCCFTILLLLELLEGCGVTALWSAVLFWIIIAVIYEDSRIVVTVFKLLHRLVASQTR
mgnify:CR=1 FL=1